VFSKKSYHHSLFYAATKSLHVVGKSGKLSRVFLGMRTSLDPNFRPSQTPISGDKKVRKLVPELPTYQLDLCASNNGKKSLKKRAFCCIQLRILEYPAYTSFRPAYRCKVV
jgi:hypothetical protein